MILTHTFLDIIGVHAIFGEQLRHSKFNVCIVITTL
jgi:hypothetical protein